MLKWSEMLGRVIPWLDTGDDEADQAARAEAAEIRREQEDLAPIIAEQTAILVRRGQMNGFTRQLRAGFQGATGE